MVARLFGLQTCRKVGSENPLRGWHCFYLHTALTLHRQQRDGVPAGGGKRAMSGAAHGATGKEAEVYL